VVAVSNNIREETRKMDRKEYNSCIARGMKGQNFTKEERKLAFCILAKTCSGKAGSIEEAKTICLQPKPPKPVSMKKRKTENCEKSAIKLAECAVIILTENKTFKQDALNINTVGAAITNALIECQCPKV
jgi:hypothetical protein